jgi:chromatin structure-remodeling complex subunit RSC9
MNQHPCKWFGCSAPIGSTSIESLYSHLYHFHLLPLSSPSTSSPETAHACHWIDCNYNTTLSSDNPLVSINELAVHLRSHLYTTSGPITTYLPTPKPPATAIMTHERYHAEVSKQDAAEITGIGFIACLVIRNIARLVKDMLIKDGVIAATSIVDPAPTNEDDVDKNQVDEETTMRSKSLFELMSLASRSDADDPLSLALESQVDYTAAKKNAMEGLEGIEEKLVMATVESHHLGRVLGEVLLVTTECAKRKRGG